VISREIALKTWEVACGDEDFDRAGRVWLLLDVQGSGIATGAAPPWQIKDIVSSIAAQTVAPAEHLALDSSGGAETK
jgi:hypothetical protein